MARRGAYTNLALHECADATLGVADDLDILDLSMLRQVLREQARELRLLDVRRETDDAHQLRYPWTRVC